MDSTEYTRDQERKIVSIHTRVRGRRVRWRPMRLLVCVVFFAIVATGAVLFISHQNDLSEDLFADLFSRLRFSMGLEEEGEADTFSFDDYMLSQFASFQNGLVLLSSNRLVVYGPSGAEKYGEDCVFSQPALAVSDRTILAYDRGGFSYFLADGHSAILKREWDNILYTVCMNREGAFALVSAERGYASVCTVFDDRQREKYVWRSREHFIIDAALSPSANLLALISCGQDGDRFDGRVTLLNTGNVAPLAILELPDTLPYYVGFLDETCLFVVTENGVSFYTDEGEVLLEWPFGDRRLMAFDTGDDFLALGLSNVQNEADTLVLLGKEGPRARKNLSGRLLYLSAAGGYIGILTDGLACIYDNLLAPVGEPAATEATALLARGDGTALLLGQNRSVVYKP